VLERVGYAPDHQRGCTSNQRVLKIAFGIGIGIGIGKTRKKSDSDPDPDPDPGRAE